MTGEENRSYAATVYVAIVAGTVATAVLHSPFSRYFKMKIWSPQPGHDIHTHTPHSTYER